MKRYPVSGKYDYNWIEIFPGYVAFKVGKNKIEEREYREVIDYVEAMALIGEQRTKERLWKQPQYWM